MKRMLLYDRKQRMKWSEIYQHPLINMSNENILAQNLSRVVMKTKNVNLKNNHNFY